MNYCNFMKIAKLMNYIIFCAVWLTCLYIIFLFFLPLKIWEFVHINSQQCEHMHEIDIGANKQMRAKGELVWLGDGWQWLPKNSLTPTTTMEAHVDMYKTHDIVWRLEISDEVHMRACAWVISVALCRSTSTWLKCVVGNNI